VRSHGWSTRALRLGLAIALLAGVPSSAAAAGWSAAVKLGLSNPGAPGLAMNDAGQALAMYGYTPSGGTGALYQSATLGAQPWKAGTGVPGSGGYDSESPDVALDDSGVAVATFKAYQIDQYPDAYMSVFRFGPANWANWSVLSSPVAQPRALVRFYGRSTAYINDAVSVFPGTNPCGLYAEVNPSNNWWQLEAIIANDCVVAEDFALDRSGVGGVVYRTSGGAVRLSARTATGVWSTPITAAKSTQVRSIAAAVSPAGDLTVAWTVGSAGTRTVAVWTLTRRADGTIQGPVQLSSTACDASVAVAGTPAGNTIVGWAGLVASKCEVLEATRLGQGAFSPPVKLTTGASAAALTSVATAGGSVVLAWNDNATSRVTAATGTVSGFGAPKALGPDGTPALAGGGGYVSAAWCETYCYAASQALR
jgi:hypothetical protein